VSPSIRRRSLYFIQVVVPPADLIVTGVGTAATTVQAGQTVSVSNSIKNQGGTQTGPFTVAFYLSTNGTVGDGDDTVSTTSRTVKYAEARGEHAGEDRGSDPAGYSGRRLLLVRKG